MKKLVNRSDIYKAVYFPLFIIALIFIFFFPTPVTQLFQGIWIAIPIVLVVLLSPWGNYKFAQDNEKPPLKLLSWLGLIVLFECLITVNFVTMRSLNPATITTRPTLYSLLPWCGFVLTAMAVGFQCFYRQQKALLSSTLRPFFNNTPTDVVGLSANQISYNSIQFAFGISLGFVILSLIVLAGQLLHLNLQHSINLLTILVVGTLMQVANAKFCHKGLRKLSTKLNFVVGIAIALVVTATLLILIQLLANKIAPFMPDFIKRPIHLPEWLKPFNAQQAWLVFSGLWWFIWTPIAAGFLIVVSRGRSFRACLLASLIPPLMIIVIAHFIDFYTLPKWLLNSLNIIASFILLSVCIRKKYLRYLIRRTVPNTETLKFRPPHLFFRGLIQGSILIVVLFWLAGFYLTAIVLFIMFMPLVIGIVMGWVGLVVGFIKNRS